MFSFSFFFRLSPLNPMTQFDSSVWFVISPVVITVQNLLVEYCGWIEVDRQHKKSWDPDGCISLRKSLEGTEILPVINTAQRAIAS